MEVICDPPRLLKHRHGRGGSRGGCFKSLGPTAVLIPVCLRSTFFGSKGSLGSFLGISVGNYQKCGSSDLVWKLKVCKLAPVLAKTWFARSVSLNLRKKTFPFSYTHRPGPFFLPGFEVTERFARLSGWLFKLQRGYDPARFYGKA